MKKGESILLCSDGLTEVVLDSEIQYQLITGTSVQKSCEALMDMALERGAPDNVTAVVLRK
jgi:protein phosphatase